MPALKAIDHVHVFVSNREFAKGWYQAVLGMKPIPSLEFWAENGGPLTISDEEGNVHLALFEAPSEKCRSTVALVVSASQLVAWRNHLIEALARPMPEEDHQVSWSVYFNDPDGNPYEITTYEHEEFAKLNKVRPEHSFV